MVHPSPFLDPAFGDPENYRYQKGRSSFWDSTVVQTFTPIGATFAEISGATQKIDTPDHTTKRILACAFVVLASVSETIRKWPLAEA